MPTLTHFDPDPFYVLLHFINHSFLISDAFHKDYSNGFPSLTELATNELQFVKNEKNEFIAQAEIRGLLKRELENSKEEKAGESVYKYDEGALSKIFEIEHIKKHLRTYHKYIAIVHADGDNMGKLIGSLLNDEDVQKFSKDLVEFAVKANKILAGERFTNNSQTNWGYGAAPVYIGGDDLVFFAPVATIDENGEFKTIFDLIDGIDKCFNDIFNEKEPNGSYKHYKNITKNRPCLTYGVSITFYKFPLREAYELSKQLMYAVKNDDYESRNRIHFVLQKHSKQNYFGIIDKNFESTFVKYIDLLKSTSEKAPTGEKSERFLNSIYKNILTNKGQYLDKSITDLEELFNNNFNEKIHKEYKPYLEEVRKWIQEMLNKQDYKKVSTFEEETLETIVSLLKFIHFIRDNEFRN
jgi:CRISPR-associated protein Cmr2